MAIKGIIVTNIGHNEGKYRAQTDEFLIKSKSIKDLELIEVKNENTLTYLEENTPDFCLFWDKDIYLASMIENRGIKVFNRPEAIYLCDDKALTAMRLTKAHVPQPKYFVFPLHFYGNIYEHYEAYKLTLLALGFPLVLKERFGSFGEQVYLAHNEETLKALIREHGTKPLLAQAFIAFNSGEDYRLNVVGNDVILSVKRKNDHDFRSNINQGGKAVLIEPTQTMKEVAIAATKAVNAHFAGVDLMLEADGTPVVIEVNSNMRTVAVSKLGGPNLTLAILQYIINAI